MGKDIIETGVGLPATAGNTPADMIRMAVAGNADLEQLEKLLGLQERWEANEARKAYYRAMAEFKKNPPEIEKDKKVGYDTSKGKVGYAHASLANVIKKITASLSEHGLSAAFNTHQNGKIKVVCRISHVLGHFEETSLEADADTSGSKNSIQALGSTVTYLERYTLLAALGLATKDQDDDAAAATPKISDEQLHTLRDKLLEIGVGEKGLCGFFKIDSLDNLPSTKYQEAVVIIDQKKSDKSKKVSK